MVAKIPGALSKSVPLVRLESTTKAVKIPTLEHAHHALFLQANILRAMVAAPMLARHSHAATARLDNG